MSDEVGSKPKKPFYKKWWFWVIAVIVVGAIAGGGSSGGSGSSTSSDSKATPGDAKATPSTSSEQPAEAEQTAEKVAKIGEPLKVGDLVFTVDDAAMTKELKNPLGDKKGNWMVVTVTVKNESKEAVLIDSSFFKVIEADGTTYETDSDNLMYLDTEQNFFLEKINPKMSKQGKALFALPDGLKDLKLHVQTGAFGTETGEISLSK